MTKRKKHTVETITVVYTIYGSVLTDEIVGKRRSIQMTGANSENSSGVVLTSPGLLLRAGKPTQQIKAAYYRNAEVMYLK